MSDKELNDSPQRSRSYSSSRSQSREKSAGSGNDQSDSPKRSRSRSRSKKHKHRSRSHSRRKHSRSRSRSHHGRHRRRSRSRSRSHSYDRKRSSRYDYDDYDDGGSRSGYARRRSRSPMSHRRRHLGDRENPQTSRCLGVFGLSLYTQERDLREVFEHYGPVAEIQIVYDHQSGRSRGFAFIYMRNHEDAVEAKEMAPGTEIDGRKIRVDYSITERAHTPTPGVYLGRPSGRRSRSPGYAGGGPRYVSKRQSRSYSRSYSRSPRR